MTKLYTRFTCWMSFNPPAALSMPGWKSFKKEFKKKAPIRYWIKYTFIRSIRVTAIKKDRLMSSLLYRTVVRYHIVKTGMNPGYARPGERMLYANFSILVDFVEKELAWAFYTGNTINSPRWVRFIPVYGTVYRVLFRNAKFGLAYLEEASGNPTYLNASYLVDDANVANEMLLLYNWWVYIRPSRDDTSYLSDIEWETEDNEMFMRLANIRNKMNS